MLVHVAERPEQPLYGKWAESSDKTLPRDISDLAGIYYAALEKPRGSILPFYVLTTEYVPATGACRLFIGGQLPGARLENALLPAGVYASVVVQPAFPFLWGASIGKAKRYFYQKWLPASGYTPLGLEYELHTQQSLGAKPSIELLFAIQDTAAMGRL